MRTKEEKLTEKNIGIFKSKIQKEGGTESKRKKSLNKTIQ